MSDTSILLTGGTGFIGSHVAERLLADGHRVRCLVRPGRPSLGWLADLRVEPVYADPSGDRAADRLMDGVHTVIHVAGVTKAKTYEDYASGNVDLTRHLLDQAITSRVQRFVLISSLTVNGPSPDGRPLHEQDPCVPITNYGRSKLEAEQVCRERAGEIDVTIMRPPAVYGPRDKDILEVFRWVSYGLRPIIGSRDKTISLIHARDLARAIATAASDPRAAGRTYLVADPEPYLFSDLIAAVASVAGRRTVPVFIPAPALYAVAAVAQGVSALAGRTAVLTVEKARDLVQRSWVCSPEAIRKDLGFVSGISVPDGVRETFEWYRSNGWIR